MLSPDDREGALELMVWEAEAPLRKEGVASPEERAAVEKFKGVATGKLIELTEKLDEYLGTLAGRNEEKSIAMKRSTITQFAGEFQYVADVQRRGVQGWVNRQGQAGKAAATIGRSLSEMRGYWKYLRSAELAPSGESPFDELSLPRAGKSSRQDQRKPFTPAEITMLIDEARQREDEQLVDLIEIARWTGARLEEICALKVDKVDVKAGYIEVEDAKTAAGWRQVPIHSKLKPTIAKLVKASGRNGYLLSGLAMSKYADRGNAIGKRFGRMKTALGFGGNLVFHSIRHTVSTLLEDAHVPENVAADILGHEKPRITYGLYSGGTSLKTKAEAIERLAYPTTTAAARGTKKRTAA